MTANHSKFDHERYEEFCALATAGALTAEESDALFAHLDRCSECSKIFAQYQSLANEGMPMLIDLHRSVAEAPHFDEASALARILDKTKDVPQQARRKRFFLSELASVPVWSGLAAASMLVSIAVGSYWLGERHRTEAFARPTVIQPEVNKASNAEPDLKLALVASRERETNLQALVSTGGEEVDKLQAEAKAAQERLDNIKASLSAAKAEEATQVASLTQQRDSAFVRLQDAEQSYQAVQEELTNLRSQRKQDLLHIASLESHVGSLTVAVNDQDKRTKSDEQYLASDKDIRDLIGARNLYIADIMDVNETGQSRRPFGRVFYTKTKSLIFYAYDLDRQPGVKQTSTFHVWGRTGAKDNQPINLGLLYMDSESNRRWTLRVNDPEQLARLDAVFVTIEPGKQIEKPSGKPFLYASLRREPNHP